MTSGTFERVRLFTDIENITLEKWLDADNAGQDELAKKILDAGLLVEHMVAEIPLEQNLTDNSELKQLAENAKATFGLIVCFGCNRAFDSKDEQLKNCPKCGAKLLGPELPPPEPKKNAPEKENTVLRYQPLLHAGKMKRWRKRLSFWTWTISRNTGPQWEKLDLTHSLA